MNHDSAKLLASTATEPHRKGQSWPNDELSERVPALHIGERLPRLIKRILIPDDRIKCAISSEGDERLEIRLGAHRATDDMLVTEEQPRNVDLRGAARGAAAHGHPTAASEELESQFVYSPPR
jgi:hypothetical protein